MHDSFRKWVMAPFTLSDSFSEEWVMSPFKRVRTPRNRPKESTPSTNMR